MELRSVRNAFLTAFVLAALAATGANATAKWTRTHAFDCKTLGGSPRDTSWALYNDSTTSEMVALCAISDTDRFHKQNITTLNIHGWDGHDYLSTAAMACRSLWHTTGGGCSPMVFSSYGRQHFTLSPNTNQWTSSTAADFGYVWVRIPRKHSNGGISSLRGIYTYGS
jgi:hypothetical protein